MCRWRGWRTVIFNVVATIVPIMSVTEWSSVLPEQWIPYYALGLALGNLYLRSITTTKVGKSQ